MRARPLLLALGALLGAPLLAVAAFAAFTFGTEYSPPDTLAMPTQCSGPTQPLQAGQAIKVLSWNLQYSASRKHQFFYDGGEAVWVPEADVAATVNAISAVLRAEAPDIALLQEIDRDSDRTGRRDQLPDFIEAASAGCTSAAPYHLARFVPKPISRPLGRVDMELAVLSRGTHGGAVRTALALMDEPRLVQALNLKRALLTAELPVEGSDQPLAVAVTHLSAFSYGDGTLKKQVAALEAWMAARPPGQPWILAGDLNLLPLGDDPKRLHTEGDQYADDPNPIGALIPRFQEAFGQALAPENRTYLPFGAAEPDRKIDYVFYGGPLTLERSAVLREHSSISDHLPIRIELRLGGGPPPDPAPTAAPADGAPPPTEAAPPPSN